METKAEKISIKAVIIGWLVDVVGSQLVGGVIGVVLGLFLASRGGGPDVIMQQAEQAMNSSAFRVLQSGTGLLLTTIGGFVTASIAKHEKLKHAVAMGILSSVSAALMLAMFDRSAPVWFYAANLLLPPFCALLGGYVRSATQKDSSPLANSPQAPPPIPNP